MHLHCSGASLKLPGHPTQKVSHTETCSLCLTTEKNSNQGQALLSLPRSLRNRQHRQQAPPELVPIPADRRGALQSLRETAEK